MQRLILILFIFSWVNYLHVSAQDTAKKLPPVTNVFDSVKKSADTVPAKLTQKDTLAKQLHDPRKATFRSAVIPGWGQAYNREYWKIPIVYGALSIPTATFIYNNTWYKRTKDAYNILVNNDTSHFGNIYPKLQGLSPESLQFYRNTFRKDRDYSVLWFFVIWGLNVVDATVFGHLKDFDVSDDLSLHLQPGYNPISKSANLGLVFKLKNSSHKKN
ncbi:MAG: DUF5683 domain-containing protein [Parafilimonas sp.]